MATFRKLFANFLIVAAKVTSQGGVIGFEWPKGCTLWKDPAVKAMMAEYGLNVAFWDGCAVGLRSTVAPHLPIRKPWALATNSLALFEALNGRTCPGKEQHHEHAPCSGSQTKLSENYTEEFADIVHNAFKLSIQQSLAVACEELAGDPFVNGPAMSLASVGEIQAEHRQKLEQWLPLFDAAVARLLTPLELFLTAIRT